MHQKGLFWRAITKAGLGDSQDPHIQEFLQFVRHRPWVCWDEIVPEFREKYYDCFDALVPMLAEVDDPLLRRNLLKYADPEAPKERQILVKMAEGTDPEKDEVSIKKLADLNLGDVNRVLRRRTLPERLQRHVRPARGGSRASEPAE